ncbi:MAG: ribosome silencing factor [Lachnospiraceae bacterium]|nr:ribosome silencing factor [Lachnospiraceae bacterium]MBR5738412.1 ribosome silencing factor [Lachnospiraceae bacterium]
MELQQEVKKIVRLAIAAIEEKKGVDPVVLDISKITVIADCFVIASADNDRQLEALAESVKDTLGRAGIDCKSVEGFKRSGWVLFDYGDVIVHLFNRETRSFYDLERIYRDAVRVDLSEL